MEARANGSHGDLEDVGDLVVRSIGEELQRDDDTVVDRQAPEPAIELVAIRDRAGGIAGELGSASLAAGHHDPPPATCRLGVRRPNDDAVRPGIEALRVPKAGQLLPHVDEGLLDSVLGRLRVAEDVVGEPEQLVPAASDQEVERFLVAVLGSLDELTFQARYPCDRGPDRETDRGDGIFTGWSWDFKSDLDAS